MKLVIYTCLFGNYDSLLTPLLPDKQFDYVCFTNNKNLKSKFWKIKYVDEDMNDIFLSRKIKILSHKYLKSYNKSIYIDANIILSANVKKLISLLNDYDLILFEHPRKHTLLKEILIALSTNKIDKSQFNNILKLASNFIFFNNNSKDIITTNRVIVRNHNSKNMINLMEKWWYEYNNKNINRDQFILPYLIDKQLNKIKIISSKFYYFNYYFTRPHLSEKSSTKIKFFIKFFIFELFFRLFCFLKKNIYKKNYE